MGFSATSPNKSLLSAPSLFHSVVPAGLKGLLILTGDIDNAAFNLVSQRRCKIIGSPVVYPAQTRLTASLDYIETDVSESITQTVMVIARSTDTFVGNARRPVFISNNSSPAEDPAATANGYTLWPLDADSMIAAAARYTNAGHTAYTSGGIQLVGVAVDTMKFYCHRVDNTRNILNNLTDGTVKQELAYSYPRYRSLGKLRVGSGYNAAYTGFCDMSLVVIWDRLLPDAEMNAAYAQFKLMFYDQYEMNV